MEKSIQNAVLEQAGKYNSFYIYDEKTILEYTKRLKDSFKGVKFLYSVKNNPYINVVKTVFAQGLGADAASLNEVLLSEKLGLKEKEIYYSAPGKTENDIKGALGKAVITADSLNEIELIDKAANEKGIVAQIGVRINPDFGFFGGKGAPSKFGIEEYQLFDNAEKIKSLKNIKITGIHVHLHSQELNIELLKKYHSNMFDLAKRVCEKLGTELEFINLGSGIGIPYAKDDKEVDVKVLGENLNELCSRFKEEFKNTQIFVETGRYAVGKSGYYACKVVDKKVSYGKTFIILSSTLNGFVRPAMAHIIEKYAVDEFPAESEPFYTCKDAFGYIVLNESNKTEKVTLCGSLCTSTDIIEEDIELKEMNIGDMLVMTNAGSYASVITPYQFASLPKAAQLMLKADGSVINSEE